MTDNIDLIAPSFDGKLSGSNYRLSIRLMPDGYSFCVTDSDGKCVAVKYIADKRRCSDIAGDILLQQRYSDITLYSNTAFTLIPNAIVERGDNSTLNSLIPPTVFPDGHIRTIGGNELDAAKSTDDIAILFKKPDATIRTTSANHYIHLLINYLTSSAEPNIVLVEAIQNYTTVAIKQNNRIVYTNTFYTATATDSAYYLFAGIEQLNIPASTPIHIVDTAPPGQNIASILKQYSYTPTILTPHLWQEMPPEMTADTRLNMFALQSLIH